MAILDESLIKIVLNKFANFDLIRRGTGDQSRRPRCFVSDIDDDLEIFARTGRVTVSEQFLASFGFDAAVMDK